MKSRSLPSPFFADENLKFMSYCPFCNAEKKAMETEVLTETGETHLLHLRCGNCQNAVLALILNSPAGLTSLGIITDLSASDVIRMRLNSERVTSDDVLELHQGLKRGVVDFF